MEERWQVHNLHGGHVPARSKEIRSKHRDSLRVDALVYNKRGASYEERILVDPRMVAIVSWPCMQVPAPRLTACLGLGPPVAQFGQRELRPLHRRISVPTRLIFLKVVLSVPSSIASR